MTPAGIDKANERGRSGSAPRSHSPKPPSGSAQGVAWILPTTDAMAATAGEACAAGEATSPGNLQVRARGVHAGSTHARS